jgi:hypothetical protein
MIKSLFVTGLFIFISSCGSGGGDSGGGSDSSLGGSTSRMVVVGNHLYMLNKLVSNASEDSPSRWAKSAIDVYSVSNPEAPSRLAQVELDIDPETLYSDGIRLFVGASTGVSIFNLDDPGLPEQVGTITHFRSCDPVVVENSLAYVTLRTNGRGCGSGSLNELQILDLAEITAPTKISSFAMDAPWGLGVYSNRAYVCDGASGLKILDVTDPLSLAEVTRMSDEVCFDLIVSSEGLIATGVSGVSQYRLVDGSTAAPVLMSRIPIKSE